MDEGVGREMKLVGYEGNECGEVTNSVSVWVCECVQESVRVRERE